MKPEAPRKMQRVFVYGTLKRKGPLHGWMEHSVYVGDAIVKTFTLISFGAYPAMIYTGDDKHGVKGEVFDMPTEDFAKLRAMEENVGYSTIDIEVAGMKLACFVYDSLYEGNVEWEDTSKIVNRKVVPSGRVAPAKADDDFVDDEIPF